MSTVQQGTALLVMDIQHPMMATYDQAPVLLENIKQLTTGARKAGIPVVYVQLAFRPGYPEVNLSNKSFRQIVKSGSFIEGDPNTEIHPSVAPQEGDIIVVKKRYSAFAGNDLEIILRSKGINQLVLAGFTTSGIVLSTVREAADKDFDLVVITDGCADREKDVHDFLMNRIFIKQAAVVSAKDWLTTL